jgi:hypothetical protein
MIEEKVRPLVCRLDRNCLWVNEKQPQCESLAQAVADDRMLPQVPACLVALARYGRHQRFKGMRRALTSTGLTATPT